MGDPSETIQHDTSGCAAVAAAVMVAPVAGAAVPTDIDSLTDAVTAEAIFDHLKDSRRLPTPTATTGPPVRRATDASAAYVAEQLDTAGYDVTVQPFDFPFFDLISQALA